MVMKIDASRLYELKVALPLIDVRSPLEFEQGHIPGAVNIPLFSNEERAKVGTLYHNAGREAALLLGLDFVGPQMSGFVKKLNGLCHHKPKEVIVYCWRGGMRSGSMAWLFSTAGFKVHLLEGGYKAYRAFIRESSGAGKPIIVLGGMTGSGKTEILHKLQEKGEQIIDLERLACNKGSVFGYLGQQVQPTNEQFENDLFEAWNKLNSTKPVWIEDESRSIGAVGIPGPFFERMKLSPMLMIDVPPQVRVQRLVHEYAVFDKALLANALIKIAQPLGGLVYNEALVAIEECRFAEAINLVLGYYDKTYRKALQKFVNREIFEVKTDTGDANINAGLLLKIKPNMIKVPFL